MSGYLSGYLNVVPVMQPHYSTTAAIHYSEYVKMDNYDQITFMVESGMVGNTTLGSSAATCTGQVAAGLYSAYSATGAGATALGAYTTAGSTTLGTAYIDRAHSAILCKSTAYVHGNTIVINDLTFTFSTVATVTTDAFDANRYVYLEQAVSATGISDTLEHLAAFINHASYGCTGLEAHVADSRIQTATSSSQHLLISGQGIATVTIQATSSENIKPVNYVSILEARSADLLVNSSHKWVCVGVTPTTQCVISVIALRSNPRYIQSATGNVEDVAAATT